MIDKKKRNTLKLLTGSAVIAVAPGIATANQLQPSHTRQNINQAISEDFNIPVSSTGTELTISLSVDPTPTVRITNHSRQLIIVRHVYPGVIHAGKQTFDINSIFERCAYAIQAGTGRTIDIQSTTRHQPETGFPENLYQGKPKRLVAVTGRGYNGQLGNSSQSYFV